MDSRDLMGMTMDDVRKLVREEAEKLNKPLVEYTEQIGGLAHRAAVRSAMEAAPGLLESAGLGDFVTDPERRDLLERLLEGTDTEALADPRTITGAALGLIPYCPGSAPARPAVRAPEPPDDMTAEHAAMVERTAKALRVPRQALTRTGPAAGWPQSVDDYFGKGSGSKK